MKFKGTNLEVKNAICFSEGLSQQEFIEGYSIPRNLEIMSSLKVLGLVGYLGSGVPRI